MKYIKIPTVVLALTLMTSAAHAVEVHGKLSISPYAGIVIPFGDAAETEPPTDLEAGESPIGGATTGFGIGGALEYGLTENVVVGGKFGYNKFGFDEEFLGDELPEGATIDGDWTIIEFGAYVKLLMAAGSNTRPYVKAGVLAGKADLKGDVTFGDLTEEGEVDISNALGIEAGVGVLHMFSNQIGGFVEGGITHLMTDGKDQKSGIGGDLEDGETSGNFQWFAIRGGLTIFFGK